MANSKGLDPNCASSAWQRNGIDTHNFGQQRTKSQIIKHHEACMLRIQQQVNNPGHTTISSTRTGIGQLKQTSHFTAPPALGDCTAIAVKDLQSSTTHRGRMLRGVLVVDAIYTGSVDTVLEDQAGGCVHVCIYNRPDVEAGCNFQRKLAAAQKVFTRGSAIAILEPFYKLMADGSYGVRVDNPAEVIFLDDSGPSDVARWQQEGKRCFQAKQYSDAAAAYNKALHLMQQQRHTDVQQAVPDGSSSDGALLLQLLLNASAACHKLQELQQSLAYAAAAVVFSNRESSKAYYRLALAMKAQAAAAAAAAAAGGGSGRGVKRAPNSLADAAIAFMSRSADLSDSVNSAADRQKLFANLATCSDSSNSSKSKGSSAEDLAAAWAAVCSIIGPAVLCLLQQQKATASDAVAQHNRAAAATAASSSMGNSTDTAAAVPGSGSSTAAELKESGNAAFRSADYQTALRHYQAALHRNDQQDTAVQAAVLLSNRSACYLQLGGQQNEQQACLDAAAAVILNSRNIKGWFRMVNALQQLTLLQIAVDVCNFALQMYPDDRDLQQLQTRITSGSTAANSSNSSSSCSNSSSTASQKGATSSHSIKNRRNLRVPITGNSNSSNGRLDGEPRHLSEQEAAKLAAGEQVGVETVSMLNNMAMLAEQFRQRRPDAPDIPLVDNRVPPFHEEFVETGRWPAQLNIPAARRMLWGGYEDARGLPLHILQLMDHKGVDEHVVVKRLGATAASDPDAMDWLFEAPIGDIRFHARRLYDGAQSYQSFTNVSARTEALTPGTTHVSIGFVDLGSLSAACKHLKSKLTAVVHLEPNVQPLRWVGYDMSAYAVAKALVLLKMISCGAIVDAVLQAWYSSIWSQDTLRVFKAALTSILQQHQADSTQHVPGTVLDLLHHWQLSDITLAAARSAWLEHSRDHSCYYIGNFKRRCDRMALAEYHVTGQLLAGDVGNVMMFAVLPECGERALDEHFLQALSFLDLMKGLQTGGLKGPNIIQVGIGLLRDRIKDLVDLLQQGAVTAEVRLGTVEPSTNTILSAIKALQPYTISWSNVPDYISPAGFHKMAQAVSGNKDTVHFMHSMNWMENVKGASHVDLMIAMSNERLPEAMPKLLKLSQQGLGALYKGFGFTNFLLSPPVENPRNVIDCQRFARHHKEWVSAFFARNLSGMRNVQQQVQIAEPPLYWVLSRSSSAMHITFTYDDQVNFTPIGSG